MHGTTPTRILALRQLMQQMMRARHAEGRAENLLCLFKILRVAAATEKYSEGSCIRCDILLKDIVKDRYAARQLAIADASLDQIRVDVDVRSEFILARDLFDELESTIQLMGAVHQFDNDGKREIGRTDSLLLHLV